MENPTSDEKVLAALAHASVFLSFLSPIGATLVWVFQRAKSKYVRYHALQAMGYQTLAYWVWFIGIFILPFGIVGLNLAIALVAGESSLSSPKAIFLIQPMFILGIFGMWGLIFLYGFTGAIFCVLGKDFRYPVIGKWLKHRVFNDKNSEEDIETWENYWVGGICHAAAIFQFWGVTMPFIVWLTQKGRSSRLKFQSLQAAIYQLLATVAYFVSYAGFILAYIFMIAIIVIGGFSTSSAQEVPPAFGMVFIIAMLVVALVWLAWMVLYPLYFILAGVATIRTMRGHDFKYPILGRIVAKGVLGQNKAETVRI